MKINRIESSSETNWANLPDEWKDIALNAIVDEGYGETPLVVVAIIASALWDATAHWVAKDKVLASFYEEDEPISAIQEAYDRGKKGYTANSNREDYFGGCRCIQDEANEWINCPVHGEYWQARMNSES